MAGLTPLTQGRPGPEDAPGAAADQGLAIGRAPARKRTTKSGLLSVIGADDRQQIGDTRALPWRMVCSLRLRSANGGVFVGTGWFVGPRTVLTAGHCILDRRVGAFVSIDVMPGRSGNLRPFGHLSVTAAEAEVHPDWAEGFDPDRDVGVLHLPEPLGERTGWFAIASPEDALLQGYLVNVAGYPAEIADRPTHGRELWWHKDAVASLSPERIFYTTDTSGGQSGGPVFAYDDAADGPIAVGIHAYGVPRRFGLQPVTEANSAPRIDPALAEIIQGWIARGEEAEVHAAAVPESAGGAEESAGDDHALEFPERRVAPPPRPAPRPASESAILRMLADPDVPMSEIQPFLEPVAGGGRPFAPSFRLRSEALEDALLPESAIALNMVNAAVRRKRQRRFRREAPTRPNDLRLVSDGDSWFLHPLITDTINHLSDRHLVFSLDGAGDLLDDIAREAQVLDFAGKVEAQGVLLSGGGNDLLGDGALKDLLVAGAGTDPAAYLDADAYGAKLDTVAAGYERYLRRLFAAFPRLHVFLHGYDYPIPVPKGPWVGKPMRGIVPPAMQAPVAAHLIDLFYDRLEDLLSGFGAQAHLVDNRGTAGALWFDEIHPSDEGFRPVADRFDEVLRDTLRPRLVAAESAPATARAGLPPLLPHMTQPVDAERERRDRRRLLAEVAAFRGAVDDLPRTESGAIPDDTALLAPEVILGEPDFLSAGFLERGAERARAVCRIRRADGATGTGTLLKGGYLITNWHVLPTPGSAASAVAEFDFEEGRATIPVAIEPGRFFLANEGRDVAIVACDDTDLDHVEPLAIPLRPSGTGVNQHVNIIQHPAGRPKEVAIRDNRVTRVNRGTIEYRTDTEPGSSGAMVYNDLWEPIALHRAGKAGDFNQAIRLDAIAGFLEAQLRGGGPEGAPQVLDFLEGTSPHLGFFGRAGVIDALTTEVEIPDFRGDGEFADLGFWNIENFFGTVPEDRIERVAEVLADMNMDAIGLIEVSEETIARTVRAMNRRGQNADFLFLDAGQSRDLAVVFDRDTTEVRLMRDVMEKHAALLEDRVEGKTVFPRTPLIAEVDVGAPDGLARFVIMVIHLKSKAGRDKELSAKRRRKAAEHLRAIADDIRDTLGLPVIMGGDYNEDLTTDVLSGLTDAPDVFTLTADDQEDGNITYLSSRFRSLIDHVIVAGDLHTGDIQGDDLGIVRFDRTIADFVEEISDHTPLVMRIVLRPEVVTTEPEPQPEPDEGPEQGAVRLAIPEDVEAVTLRFT